MNSRTTLFRRVALASVFALGVAACGDNVVTVPPTPTLSVSPNSLQIQPGQSGQFSVSIGGTDNTAFTVSHSGAVSGTQVNGNIVTVTVAAGATPGQTGSVNVQSSGHPSLAATVQVVVSGQVVEPGDEPRVQITSVTQAGTIFPLDPENVSGLIDVTMQITRGNARDLVVELIPASGDGAGQPISIATCQQQFGTTGTAADGLITAADLSVAANQVDVVCTVNTEAFDTVTGAVRFLNRDYTLRTRLRDAGGQTLDQAQMGPYTFRNQDTFRLTRSFSSANTGIDGQGLIWNTGAVTVTALPVMYSGNSVAQLTIGLHDNVAGGALLATRTDTEAPFSVTFPSNQPLANNGVSNVERPLVASVTASALTTGLAGPTTAPAPASFPLSAQSARVFRLDNVAPDGGTFVLTQQNLNPGAGTAVTLCCSNNWVGENYSFASGKAGHSDAGSGIGEITFHVGAQNLGNTAISETEAVEGGSDLDETSVNTGLRAVAVVRDRVGNITRVPLATNAANPQNVAAGATLGVDRTAPTASFANASVGDQSIFNIDTGAPANNFVVQFSDAATGGAAPSGFAAAPVLARVIRWFPNLSAENQCVAPGVWHNSTGCRLSGSTGTTAVPAANDGYYTYHATAVDQAGNLSHPIAEPISRIVLNDQNAPSASNIAIPSTLTGGQSATFTADASDNLNLWRADFRLVFGATETLPFSERQMFNSRFVTAQNQLVTSAPASATITFVRSLETTAAGAPTGTLQPATDASFRIEDAAGNDFLRTNAFAGGTVAPGASFNTRGVVTFQVSTPGAAQNVWNGAGTQPAPANNNPASRTLTATATGASGTFANPFAALHFYRRTAGGVVELIGTAPAPAVTDDGATRTWSWSITFTPAGLAAQANVPIFAVGVHSSGDALRSADNTNISIVAGT